MQIQVKSLQGDEYILDCHNDQSIYDIKSAIRDKADGSIPIERQKLVFKGQTLHDSKTVGYYNLVEGCKVYLILQKDNPPAEELMRTPSRFETILRERLVKHFPVEAVERIMADLLSEINADINLSSLDDLERLAKQKLNISH